MTVRVKICGVNSAEAIDAAVAGGADWIGFVFFPASPRYVTPAGAASLYARHACPPSPVGLFVEPTDGEIAAALEAVRLQALQVYAPAGRVAAVRARFGLPVWQALGIAASAELPIAAAADALVIEPKPPKGATRPGGNAVRLDWSVLSGWSAPVPWLLAGGLTPANVAQALAESGATSVDVSSGVERAPGVKDAGLIARFVAAARGA